MLVQVEMSLIPNESYSFPDSFVRTVHGSEKPEEKISLPPAAKPSPLNEPPLEPLAVRPELSREQLAAPPQAKPEEQGTVPRIPPLVIGERPGSIAPAPPVVKKEPARRPLNESPTEPPAALPELTRELLAAPPQAKPEKQRAVRRIPPPIIRERPRSIAPVPPIVKRAPARNHVPAVVHLKRKVRYNAHLVAPEPSPQSKAAAPPVSPVNGALQQKPQLPQAPGLIQHPVRIPTPRPVATRGPASTPCPNVPVVPFPVASAPAIPAEEQIEFELLDVVPSYPKRWSRKLVRFLVCEGIAVAALMLFAILGLLRTFTGRSAGLYINILTIAAAVVATLIPILFFAVGPTLPRDDR